MPTASSPQCGPSGHAGSENEDMDKRCTCTLCTVTVSRRSDLKRHNETIHEDESHSKPFKCDFNGCSYSAYQPSNLKVHMKIHAKIKDQRCMWPNPTGKLCKFRCSDPSSLNRHAKRHVQTAILKGENIPMEFRKYEMRIKNKSRAIGVKENVSPSSPRTLPTEPPVSDVQNNEVSDLNLNLMASKPVVDTPHPIAETSAIVSPETAPVPTATVPHTFEQTQNQQIHPMGTWANNPPTDFYSNLLGSDRSRTQHQPPLSMDQTANEYSIVIRRMKQLAPILAKSKRPLSTAEMKEVLCWIVKLRDGFSPDRFFTKPQILPKF